MLFFAPSELPSVRDTPPGPTVIFLVDAHAGTYCNAADAVAMLTDWSTVEGASVLKL